MAVNQSPNIPHLRRVQISFFALFWNSLEIIGYEARTKARDLRQSIKHIYAFVATEQPTYKYRDWYTCQKASVVPAPNVRSPVCRVLVMFRLPLRLCLELQLDTEEQGRVNDNFVIRRCERYLFKLKKARKAFKVIDSN